MDFFKAQKIATITNKILYFDNRIKNLSHSYKDDFSIYYNGFHQFDLSIDDVNFLLNHYKNEKNKLELELQKL